MRPGHYSNGEKPRPRPRGYDTRIDAMTLGVLVIVVCFALLVLIAVTNL